MKRKSLAVFSLTLIVASAAFFGSGVADASRHATIAPGTVVFTQGTTILGTVAMKPGQGLDVKWKAGKCVGGFDSPPVAGSYAPPGGGNFFAQTMFAPCHVKHASVRRNVLDSFTWYCYWDSNWNFHCGWDWTSSTSLTESANLIKATSGSLNLAKGHITGATQMANGKRTTVKVNVPQGTTGVHWVGPSNGATG